MEELMRKKTILYVLYGLLALMVIFSLLALGNLGREGYEQCLEDKCDHKGAEFCTKAREINNCCLGAGGQLAVTDKGYECVFS